MSLYRHFLHLWLCKKWFSIENINKSTAQTSHRLPNTAQWINWDHQLNKQISFHSYAAKSRSCDFPYSENEKPKKTPPQIGILTKKVFPNQFCIGKTEKARWDFRLSLLPGLRNPALLKTEKFTLSLKGTLQHFWPHMYKRIFTKWFICIFCLTICPMITGVKLNDCLPNLRGENMCVMQFHMAPIGGSNGP